MKFKRLAFFDFDGTLTDAEEFIYTEIRKALVIPESVFHEDFRAYRAGELSYPEWVNRDIAIFKKYQLTKEKLRQIVGDIRPMMGARETLKVLRERHFGIVVVSGGIDLAVEVSYPDHAELFDEVYINRYFFDIDGKLQSAVPTPYDQKHKATCIKDVCKKHGVDIKDTVFTGDNVNDVEAAQTAGISFAFNTDKSSLIAAATHHIKEKDLREILKYI